MTRGKRRQYAYRGAMDVPRRFGDDPEFFVPEEAVKRVPNRAVRRMVAAQERRARNRSNH